MPCETGWLRQPGNMTGSWRKFPCQNPLQGKECHIKSWTWLLFPLLATEGFSLLALGGENRFCRWWESRRGRVRLYSCGNKYASVSFVWLACHETPQPSTRKESFTDIIGFNNSLHKHSTFSWESHALGKHLSYEPLPWTRRCRCHS